MSFSKQLRAVFPTKNSSSEPELEAIRFSVPPIYSEKVKISNWQDKELSEPRDRTNFFPPKGNLYLSSYKRLGNEECVEWISEAKSSQQKIFVKDDRPQFKSRLMSMFPFPSDLCGDKEGNIIGFGDTSVDYRTTTKRDFQILYPLKPPPPPPKEPPKFLYRRTLGYSLQDLERRKGSYTFLDDNLEMHEQIAALKIQRHRSYDPLRKSYTEPYKYVK